MYPPWTRGRDKEIGWKSRWIPPTNVASTCKWPRVGTQEGSSSAGRNDEVSSPREAGKGVKYTKEKAINFYGRKLSLARVAVPICYADTSETWET